MKYAAAQFIGERELQEDFCGFRSGDVLTLVPKDKPVFGESKKGLCCVLADGMGGHEAGEVASRLVGEFFLVSPACSGAADAAFSKLRPAVLMANGLVALCVDQYPSVDGMGTTLVGVRVDENVLRWASVGDSHLYLLRGDKFHKLNEDHSMKPAIEAMVMKGIISKQEAVNHPDRHALRSAILGQELDLIDVEENGILLQEGDIVLLASDGLDTISTDRIIKIIKRWKFANPRWIVSALIRAVKGVNLAGQDNVSIIALSV